MEKAMSVKKLIRLVCLEMGDEDFKRESEVSDVLAAYGRLCSMDRDPDSVFTNEAMNLLDDIADETSG